MSQIRPRRSALYLPASNARAIEKAREIACDVVILDLEDAVAPDAKAEARRLACQAATDGGFGRRELVIRVNGLDTEWGHDDLAAVSGVPVDAILVPKISTAKDVEAYAAAQHTSRPLWLMIETCAAMFNLPAIAGAGAAANVAAWVIGSNDLAKEMRCRPGTDRLPLQSALTSSVLAARAAGIAIIDGVFNGLDDEAGMQEQCEQGVRFGFDGKTLIHPKQVPVANAVFSPSEEEVLWARKVVAAFDDPENSSKGAIRLDNKMVERLHLVEAGYVLAIAEAI